MFYKSTRNEQLNVTSAKAIAQGISEEGGLFVPNSIPEIPEDELKDYIGKSYKDVATAVLKKYLTDFTAYEIAHCVNGAYSSTFDTDNVVSLANLDGLGYILELWHGPTCAFKDVALQILPYLLTTSVKKLGIDKEVVILVATSGDTGKAALEGFKDVDGTKIMVFYPDDGVSPMQKLQMVTQEGENVSVCAIKGNFDDAQTGVKKIFTDPQIVKTLSENGLMFSSANSINWGRLLPQIVYYVYSYVNLVDKDEIAFGDKINVVVPTGNFGNILAAYYAKNMGVPIDKLICASNSNNVLTDFIKTGVYDRNRQFFTTISPSMDILISSNLERLMYHMSGSDEAVRKLYSDLSSSGRFEVGADIKSKLDTEFYAGYCSDEETLEVIKSAYNKYSYTIDTHTAVAYSVYEKYVEETGDKTPTVIASTASPYKFSASVLEALGESVNSLDEFALTEALHKASKMPIPNSLASLNGKEVRFDLAIEKEAMQDYIFGQLNIK